MELEKINDLVVWDQKIAREKYTFSSRSTGVHIREYRSGEKTAIIPDMVGKALVYSVDKELFTEDVAVLYCSWEIFKKLSPAVKFSTCLAWIQDPDALETCHGNRVKDYIKSKRKELYISHPDSEELVQYLISNKLITNAEVDVFVNAVSQSGNVALVAAAMEYKNTRFGTGLELDLARMDEADRAQDRAKKASDTRKKKANANPFKWNLREDGTYEIIGFRGNLEVIEVPETWEGIAVTKIGADVFRNKTGIREIILPNGLKEIGSCAFRKCTDLERIHIPETVQKIGSHVFCDCTNLTSVTIPYGIRTMESAAFFGCEKLETLRIPETVTFFYKGVFGKNSVLKLLVTAGSAAETYAKENNIPFVSE